MMKKAVILLSGGLDSATIAAIALKENYQIYALSFDYGQRHKIELESAKKLAKFFQAKEHKIAEIDLRIFGGSALTSDIKVPKNRAENSEIPVTYVPARNTIFLSYALAYAEVIGASDIFIGVNAIDYSGYPDCRPEFISAFEKMANLATADGVGGRGIKIQTPLLNLSKKEIIKTGLDLKVDYSITHSCYDPIVINGEIHACGTCDSCHFRLNGFAENGVKDPCPYIA
ncbi:MAG: queC [Rickettsiaceae bacterium]|jgi:7-cyano-7-deazaguanine synthase|nr:queC [Rickettsiaceae bacterium]